MKIFRISVDVSKFQWVLPELEGPNLLTLMQFDCKAKGADFQRVPWYVLNPTKIRGNFFNIGPGTIGFDQKVFESGMVEIFEMAGEILAIEVEDVGKLYILNVLECANCLDKGKSEIERYPNGEFRRVTQYSFHPNRLSESSLFKIPETCKIEILTFTGLKGYEEEFKSMYEDHSFTGLSFEELWSGNG
jgi:hypothetical protein